MKKSHVALVSLVVGVAIFPSFVRAADVSSDASQAVDSRRSKAIDNSESLQLRKSQTKRAATGKERRASSEKSRETRAGEQIHAELQAATLFIPLIQRIERGEIDTGNNSVAALIRQCRFFSESQLVPIAPGGEEFSTDHLENRAILQVLYNDNNRIGIQPSTHDHFLETRMRVNGEALWKRASWHYDTATVYRFAPPRDAVRCYYTYGLTLARAIERLSQGARMLRLPQGSSVALIPGALDEKAAVALASAIKQPGLRQDIENKTLAVTSRDCVLPTPYAFDRSDLSWICGPFKASAENATAAIGTVTILGENQFMGYRLSFAQVASADLATRASDSRSSYASSDSASESGQEASVAKRKSSTIDQSVSGKTAAQATLRATPR